jgi:hypothetical protein
MAAFLFATLLIPGYGPPVQGQARATPDTGRYYPETRHTLAPQFVAFYDLHGGLPLFGFPITEARTEGGYLVQWTQRERLEWHPENAGTGYEVLLGLLGRELTRGLNGPSFTATKAQAESSSIVHRPSSFFQETGHSLAEPFASYWLQNGGLAVFGYPISEPFNDDSGSQVQWFERARFEYHPELPAPFVVSLGLLGVETLDRSGAHTYEVRIANNAVTGSPLQLGLAQGGESSDPGFFDNVRTPGTDLGPALVRLDNIFNFYDIVHRSPSGTLEYRWDDLDRVVDGVKAMGKDPFICLSYMPETVSASGSSRVQPPANYDEWAALVRATVVHLNVERKLGIRYWEVWNEPNQWDFWKASFEDYMKLYDVTAAAVISADNAALVGGPAFSNFEPSGIEKFLEHEAAPGAGGRVDFLSWHAYGVSETDMAAQIRQARELANRYPQLHPQLMITEFNVSPGGPGDTSAGAHTDTVQGAIALLQSIESMQRERLDAALLFELKDGGGPARYWGRWGVLTNDGQPKPIYYALKAYLNRPGGMLPVSFAPESQAKNSAAESAPDGTLGLMAFGGPARSSLLLWYTGQGAARTHLSLPTEFANVDYDITVFDRDHNNPAAVAKGSGDPAAGPSLRRNAADLVLDVVPNSLLVLTSVEQGSSTGSPAPPKP